MPPKSKSISPPAFLDFDAYALTLKAADTALSQGWTRLMLDLSATTRAFPDGIVPLIATAMRWRKMGISVEVTLPHSPPLRGVFDRVGWSQYLQAPSATYEDIPLQTPRFTPVRPFSRDELGILHDSIMRVLISDRKLAEGLPDALHWALWEVMDNVLNHAQVESGWVQASTFREHHHVNIVVVDSGVGIAESFSERHSGLSEREAIKKAVEMGETRDPEKYKGYGLFGCREIAVQSGGRLLVVSGSWHFVQEGRKPGGGVRREPIKKYLPLLSPHQGTIIELVLRTDQSVDIARALGRDKPLVSILELTRAHGDEYKFDVASEASNLGTRDAGRRLRTAVRNLTEGRSDPIVLDFTRARMISSSFADEFVAKLAKEIGRERFNTQFELRGMNPTVNTVIQIALWERLK